MVGSVTCNFSPFFLPRASRFVRLSAAVLRELYDLIFYFPEIIMCDLISHCYIYLGVKYVVSPSFNLVISHLIAVRSLEVEGVW